MAIEEGDTVDVIHRDRDTGDVILTIADQLDWSDQTRHLALLQTKVYRYLDFVEGGEIAASYPSSVCRRKIIEVVFRYQPVQLAKDLLQALGNHAREADIQLRWKHVAEPSADVNPEK